MSRLRYNKLGLGLGKRVRLRVRVGYNPNPNLDYHRRLISFRLINFKFIIYKNGCEKKRPFLRRFSQKKRPKNVQKRSGKTLIFKTSKNVPKTSKKRK